MNKLPQSLTDRIEALCPGETVEVAIRSDIGHDGRYGEEWLIVTGERLLVFPAGMEEPSMNLAIADLTKIEARTVAGAGAIEVETAEGMSRAVHFTEARSGDFQKIAEGVRELMAGKEMTEKHRTSDRKLCENCHRPVPEDMRVCPYCVEKRQVLLRILSFAAPYKKDLGVIFVITTAMTIAGLIVPYMSKIFIDVVFKIDPVTNDFLHPEWHMLCIGALVLAYVLQSIFAGIHEFVSGTVGFKTVYDVRTKLFSKLQELSLSFFDKRHTGSIMARVNQDTAELQRLLVDFIPITLECVLTLVGVGALLFVISWRLTVFVFIPVAVTVLFLRFILPVVRAYFHRFFHRRSRLSALVNDSISGIRVIKAFGQESVEIGKFDRSSSSYRDAGIDLVRRWSIFHPFMHFTIMMGNVVVWLVGGMLILRGEALPGKLTLGDVVAYSGYLMMFYRPVFVITRMSEMITHAVTAAERIFDVIDLDPCIKDAEEAVAMPSIKGAIDIKEVTFGYNIHEPVIKNMTLSIRANEMIGLVGKSGAGKSTLINLMSRLYDVNDGSISIDGIDIREVRQSDLRQSIGVVLQETYLFSGSIVDNISYARPDASREEVIEAAMAAYAHEFIVKKPDGYDTIVGERGSRLSGGEKQRISIARAILRDPRILILDEATSSVDVETEGKIQQALVNLTKGRTTIAIAHRLATLRNCSRLVVVEDGEVAEIGTHRELLDKKGVFYHLVEAQEEHSTIIAVDG